MYEHYTSVTYEKNFKQKVSSKKRNWLI